jgi:hypothetical protein
MPEIGTGCANRRRLPELKAQMKEKEKAGGSFSARIEKTRKYLTQ